MWHSRDAEAFHFLSGASASSVDSLSGYTAASTSPVLARLGQVVVIRNSGQISIAAGFLLALSREIIPLDDHTRLHRFVVGCHPLPKGPIRDAHSLDNRSVSQCFTVGHPTSSNGFRGAAPSHDSSVGPRC